MLDFNNTSVRSEKMSGCDNCVNTELLYHVQVLPFISGVVFDSVEKHHLTPTLHNDVGEMLGRVNSELKVCKGQY